MADYKDLVGSILNLAKDAAQDVGITDVIEKGTQRAKSFGNVTKLTMDLNREHKELDRVFAEIGKLYYRQTADQADDAFSPLFEQVASIRASIAEKEAEIESYKSSFEPTAGGAAAETAEELNGRIDEFESIVNQTESDGTSL